jgi:phosphoribosylformylglycinamidine synthase subunit PurL
VLRPQGQDVLRADDPARLTSQPATGESMRADLLALLGSAAGSDKSWVTEQYDKDVRGNTVLATPHDAGVLRIDEDSRLGVAIATDGNGRFCLLDPYAGTQLALAEAYRNVAAAGARPIAVTNCLNFGSPEDPAVMWQFAEAVRGLADGCLALGIPVTGGNVSFYNQTGTAAIQPTPVVGVLGVLDDVRHRLPSGFGAAGETIMLLGRTDAEFGGSLWAAEVHGHVGGVPPVADLAAEQRLAAVLAAAAARGLLSAAHDLSDGGLALALAECCMTGGTRAARADGVAGTGCVVSLPAGAGDSADPLTALFSESAARAIAVPGPGAEAEFTELCAVHEVPASRLGHTGGVDLEITGLFTIPVAQLSAVSSRTLPGLFGQR